MTTLALVMVAVGCSSDDDTATGAPEANAPPGLTVTLQRSTLMDTERAFRMGVTYEGDEDLHLGEIQLSTPLFEPVEAEDQNAVIRADGPGMIMPLHYGEPRCDEDDADDADA